jgi:CheY-specific phosphatase CheX
VQERRTIFDHLVRSCATDAFAGEGIPLRDSDGRAHLELIAVIGFSGRHMRGALGIGAVREVARAANATSPEDWLGEISNRVLGRLKNRLLTHDVEISLALPMVLRGVRVELADGSEVWSHAFASAHGPVSVWLDARFDGAFSMTPVARESPEIATEGELVLF